MDNLAGIMAEAVRDNPADWLDAFGKIQKTEGDVSEAVANVYQRKIAEVIEYCYANQLPCRIVAVKPRQGGSSTIAVAAGYRHLQRSTGRGLVAGGALFQSQNLFKMLRIFAEHDAMQPKTCNVLDREAKFKNGSTMERITLANPSAGRSGTYQFLLITEVAYLSREGVANADDVLAGLLKTVHDVPNTLVIRESTANGASGNFYDSVMQAVSFEDFKAGKPGTVLVFSPWHEFPNYVREPAREQIASEDDYTPSEAEEADKWRLSMEQVAWMRYALRELCNGSIDTFNEDFPPDLESAFLRSGRVFFGSEGLKHQEVLTQTATREFGVMERGRNERIMFRPTTEGEASCVRLEQARPGCRYLVAVDPATGADQTGGSDPDSHSVIVLRAGFLQNGEWHEPAVVCRNALHADGVRFGCWWAIDVLEEEVARMAEYYGDCLIVPELNMDRGMIELLKARGANIYERTMFNKRENTRMKAYGWMTNVQTRGMILENLARAVRESGRGMDGEGVEVRCPWAVRQMKNFVVRPNGRAEAAGGYHDDDVLALAIGLQCLDEATAYQVETRDEWLPRDLRNARQDRRHPPSTFS